MNTEQKETILTQLGTFKKGKENVEKEVKERKEEIKGIERILDSRFKYLDWVDDKIKKLSEGL